MGSRYKRVFDSRLYAVKVTDSSFDSSVIAGKLYRLLSAVCGGDCDGCVALGDAGFGGGQERPILENSTACTMSNAKNPTVLFDVNLFRVGVGGAADSFGNRLNNKASQF